MMPAANVLDYSGWRPNPAELKAAGVVAVSRYGSYSAWKNLTAPELKGLLDVGIDVCANWETVADPMNQSTAQIAKEGRDARAFFRSLGWPDNLRIYYSFDTSITPDELPGAIDRMRAFVDGGGQGPQRCYGTSFIIDAFHNAGLIDMGWRTAARGWFGNSVRSQFTALDQLVSKSYPQFPPAQYDENLLINTNLQALGGNVDVAVQPYSLVKDVAGIVWCVSADQTWRVKTVGAALGFRQALLRLGGFGDQPITADATIQAWLTEIPDALETCKDAEAGRAAAVGAAGAASAASSAANTAATAAGKAQTTVDAAAKQQELLDAIHAIQMGSGASIEQIIAALNRTGLSVGTG